MSIKPNYSGQYSAKNNEVIISEGLRTSSILLMLQGKIDVFLSPDNYSDIDENNLGRNCRLFSLEQNTFLGVNDVLTSGKNTFSFRADEQCTLFSFAANSIDEIKNLVSTQKDYSTYMVSSLASLLDSSYNAFQRLLPLCKNIDNLTQMIFVYFWALKDKYYFEYSPTSDIFLEYRTRYEDMKNSRKEFFPIDFDSFPINDKNNDVDSEDDINLTGIEYFTKLLNIPVDVRKSFFSSDFFVSECHMHLGSEILSNLAVEIKKLLNSLYINVDYLYFAKDSLFSILGDISIAMSEDKEASASAFNILEDATKIFLENIEKLQNEFSCFTDISQIEVSAAIEKVRTATRLSNDTLHSSISTSSLELPDELRNSMDNILQYCSYPLEKIDSFNKRISEFRLLRDKASTDSDARSLRVSLANDFFDIYEKAYKKTQADGHCPRIISMFLNFGYMDERLLTKEQVITLYRLCDKQYPKSKYSIFSPKEWLEQIYTQQKETSINEFGQDYYDIFRDMKKRKLVTDLDKVAYDGDYNAKLNFEINNMIKTNQKVCHGHISSYFPILHKDNITRDLEKAVVTPTKIQQSLDRILSLDFSVFYREIWYKNDFKGIEKEPIMKEVLPDIVIVPTFGSRPSMWQEITGRARNTPGRFILPAFTDENLDDMILKLIGNFRWELCRTMMGVSWNDITEKSLTSEYTDYIQFYKKNRDLSEDTKQKIKTQIQKNRNMMRDIFTADYNFWINFESKGVLRLNKVVRSILFKYCPFEKSLRATLSKQPAFSDIAMQLNVSKSKTTRMLESKYSKLTKNNTLDRDMELNLIYYRDL